MENGSKPTIEQLVDSYNKAKSVIEETEAEIDVIKNAIIDTLKIMKMDGIRTKTGYFVKKVTSTSFSGVELSTARELGATMQKEVADVGMLRKLKEKGIEIAGSKTIQYVRIDEIK